MKKRVFYVVNLDRSRIYILAGGAALCLFVVFTIGMRLGRASAERESERPLAMLEPAAVDPTAADPAGAASETAPEAGDDSAALADTDLDARLRREAAALNAAREQESGARASESRQERVLAERAGEPRQERVYSDRASRPERADDARVATLANLPEPEPGPTQETRRTRDAERRAAESREERRARDAERRAAERREAAERRASERRRAERAAERRAASERAAERAAERRATAERAAERTTERRATTERAPERRVAPQNERTAQSENKTQQFRTLPSATERAPSAPNSGSALLTVEGGAVSRETPPTSRPSTPAPQAEPQKTQESRRTHSLQLGAFRSRAAADRMAESLRSQGFRPYIQSAGDSHVVRVGRAASSQELSPVEDRLRSHNYAPMRVAD